MSDTPKEELGIRPGRPVPRQVVDQTTGCWRDATPEEDAAHAEYVARMGVQGAPSPCGGLGLAPRQVHDQMTGRLRSPLPAEVAMQRNASVQGTTRQLGTSSNPTAHGQATAGEQASANLRASMATGLVRR